MKIMVLAGGADQIALIQELKRRDHRIILVDYFENPPAKSYADKHIVASTLDVDSVEMYARSEKIDLLCTACTDQALLTVAKVSEILNLPCYLSYQTALNVTNKSYMKQVLTANRIPTAKYRILDCCHIASISDFQFPLVVKPVDCNSSKGVRKVKNEEECKRYLDEAIRLSRTGTAIVEEYKEGLEISADFYIQNGEAKYLSATYSQKIKNRNSFTILSSDYPAINESQRDKLIQIVSEIAKAFNLNNCPLLIQLIVNGDEMNVIEFSARMGGGSKYHLINVLSGVNIMSVYVDRILGSFPTVEPHPMVNFCRMVYIYCQSGIFDHVEGFQELQNQQIIDSYFVYKTKGMQIHHAETSGDRPAGYLVSANSRIELEEKVAYANNNLKIISLDGRDIMLHNLL